MSRSEELHAASFSLTALVLDKKYEHMKGALEMLMGGLILPALVEEDVSILSDPEHKKLLDQYTKEKVLAFFNPQPTSQPPTVQAAPVQKAVEKSPKPTPQPQVNQPQVNQPQATTPTLKAEKIGGKYRRLKLTGVEKVRRFERELEPADRDHLIRWWNTNQRLVPEDDPVCKKLADELNTANPTGTKPLSPLQMAGYFSYLCRLGMWTSSGREERISTSIARGRFSVPPQYSPALINAIVNNYNAERADEKLRREAHAAKLQQLHGGTARTTTSAPEAAPVSTFTSVMTSEPAPEAAPEPAIQPTTEDFDIQFSV